MFFFYFWNFLLLKMTSILYILLEIENILAFYSPLCNECLSRYWGMKLHEWVKRSVSATLWTKICQKLERLGLLTNRWILKFSLKCFLFIFLSSIVKYALRGNIENCYLFAIKQLNFTQLFNWPIIIWIASSNGKAKCK